MTLGAWIFLSVQELGTVAGHLSYPANATGKEVDIRTTPRCWDWTDGLHGPGVNS
jgi:hypothetical protein